MGVGGGALDWGWAMRLPSLRRSSYSRTARRDVEHMAYDKTQQDTRVPMAPAELVPAPDNPMPVVVVWGLGLGFLLQAAALAQRGYPSHN